MRSIATYRSATAFRRALEDRLKKIANERNQDLQRLRRVRPYTPQPATANLEMKQTVIQEIMSKVNERNHELIKKLDDFNQKAKEQGDLKVEAEQPRGSAGTDLWKTRAGEGHLLRGGASPME